MGAITASYLIFSCLLTEHEDIVRVLVGVGVDVAELSSQVQQLNPEADGEVLQA